MRLLWISNDPRLAHVGQSRVSREILARFHRAGIEVHTVAMGGGQPVYSVPYVVHAYPYQRHEYPKALIEQIKPDIIVCSHDCWLFYWLEQCRQDFPTVKLAGYYTLDGGPVHTSWLRTMRPLDLLVTSTRFGKNEIYARYPEKHISVIPYGIDHAMFNCTTSKAQCKKDTDARTKEQSQNPILLAGKCLFTFVGQNQSRKNVAAILDAFDIADLPDSHLMMIAHSFTAEIGGWTGMGDYDLQDLVGGLEHKERITVALDVANDETIASLYRCADFFVLPSQGEAPGLPILESMACGCVPIVTNYAGAAEVSAGYKLPFTALRGQFNVIRAIVSAETLATAMVTAYDDWKSGKVKEYSAVCCAVAKEYHWEKTAAAWLQHIQGLSENRVLLDTETQICL